ncbi:MAG: hypothetical protein HC834_09055, partial [Rhodospirillales bacterium]|nr:hypothetical protein [Rhodospirillales bacterium]
LLPLRPGGTPLKLAPEYEEWLIAAMRHGAHVVDLQGEVTDSALIRDVQWDAYGINVLHLDLTRVSATEVVAVSAVELAAGPQSPFAADRRVAGRRPCT